MSTPFFHTLRELRAGMTLEDLSGEMAKAVQAWILEFQEKARERC